MAEKSRKPRPKKSAAVAVVTPPPVTVTPFPAPLGPPPPSVVGPPPGTVQGEAWIPWGEVESAYLVPTISPDGATAKWPNLIEISERFGIALQTVRDRSAAEGWRVRQKAAMKLWWSDRSTEIQDEIGFMFASFRRQIFTGAAKGALRATNLLTSNEIDSAAGLRAVNMLRGAYDAGSKAAGIASQSEVPGFGVQVNLSGVERSEPGSGSLWQVLIQARRDAVPAVDAFDLPSPLPPSLASTR